MTDGGDSKEDDSMRDSVAPKGRNRGSGVTSWLSTWLPRPSLTVLLIALAALIEVVVLGWVQWQNYLAFLPTQGDLGNYNQALYTTTHSQGFFYYTTNIPGGSNGNFWGTHFAPILFVVIPFYMISPSAFTLVVIKQLALAFGAIPLFAIAKIYFRKDAIPVLFAACYLVSPLLLTTDWNSFDLEPLFPLVFLIALYFFCKGRFWPFVGFWLLSLAVIETTAPLLALFAIGGLIGGFLSKSASPYWTSMQQRRPLLIALIVSLVWLGVAYAELSYLNPRGATFGNAYAIRYSILGANSIPDVIPRALTHPGAAGAALQYQSSLKILFVELIIISTGALWLVGGFRYLLPLLGYLALALLSNNPSAYSFGVEQPALLLGILFAGSVEGAVVLSDWLGGVEAGRRHEELRAKLTDKAAGLLSGLGSLGSTEPIPARFQKRYERAILFLKADQLGSAERELKLLERDLNHSFPDKIACEGVAQVTEAEPSPRGSGIEAPRPRSRWFVDSGGNRSLILSVAVVLCCVVPAAALSNPLLLNPLGRDPSVRFGDIGPGPQDYALQDVLDLVPQNAPVLTTSHLFPQLSNRPDAYIVPSQGALPGNENISTELNQWTNQSSYVAIDYIVDPLDAVILQNDTNLTGFGVYAADDGAVLLERGWTSSSPVLWGPWSDAIAGGGMSIKQGQGSVINQFATSLGPTFYHPPGGSVGSLLWSGPSDVDLPRGSYSVTFDVEYTASSIGPQFEFRVTSQPGYVRDPAVLNVGGGREYRIASVAPSSGPSLLSAQSLFKVNTTNSAWKGARITLAFNVTSTGYVSFPGYEESTKMALVLVSVNVVQTAAYV